MTRYLKLVGLFLRVSIQNDAAYRLDFCLRVVMAALQLVGELLGLWIIFHNTPSLAGWNVYQVLVLLGVFRLMAGTIGLVIAPNMRRIMEDVRQGTLDFVLTKPVNNQFFVTFRQFVVWRATDLLIGAGLVGYGAWHVAAAVSPTQVAAFVLLLATGATIIYSFWLVLATTTFWWTRIENIEMVFWNVFEAGRYPIDIYPRAVRWALTYVVPLAFIVTFPAGALAGKTGPGQVVTAVLVAAASLAAASAFWRYGLRHYSGASA